MRALLDTHAFVWSAGVSTRVSQTVRSLLADEANEIFFSIASAWELAIKFAQGRLDLPEHPDLYIPTRMDAYGLTALPIVMSHALRVAHLPPLHRDPFDRLLIAQAQVESLSIITSDPNIARYDVEVIW